MPHRPTANLTAATSIKAGAGERAAERDHREDREKVHKEAAERGSIVNKKG